VTNFIFKFKKTIKKINK